MSNDMPLAVHQLTKAEAAEWDQFEAQGRPGLDRVSCLHCLNRSGTRCEVLGTQHVPLALVHRCAHFRTRKAA